MSFFSLNSFFSSFNSQVTHSSDASKSRLARPSEASKSSFLNLSTIKSTDKKVSIYERLKDMPTLDEKTVKPKEDLDATIIKNSKDSIIVHKSLQKIKQQDEKISIKPEHRNKYLANMKQEIQSLTTNQKKIVDLLLKNAGNKDSFLDKLEYYVNAHLEKIDNINEIEELQSGIEHMKEVKKQSQESYVILYDFFTQTSVACDTNIAEFQDHIDQLSKRNRSIDLLEFPNFDCLKSKELKTFSKEVLKRANNEQDSDGATDSESLDSVEALKPKDFLVDHYVLKSWLEKDSFDDFNINVIVHDIDSNQFDHHVKDKFKQNHEIYTNVINYSLSALNPGKDVDKAEVEKKIARLVNVAKEFYSDLLTDAEFKQSDKQIIKNVAQRLMTKLIEEDRAVFQKFHEHEMSLEDYTKTKNDLEQKIETYKVREKEIRLQINTDNYKLTELYNSQERIENSLRKNRRNINNTLRNYSANPTIGDIRNNSFAPQKHAFDKDFYNSVGDRSNNPRITTDFTYLANKLDPKALKLRLNAENEGKLIEKLENVYSQITVLKEKISNTHSKLEDKSFQIINEKTELQERLNSLKKDYDFIKLRSQVNLL